MITVRITAGNAGELLISGMIGTDAVATERCSADDAKAIEATAYAVAARAWEIFNAANAGANRFAADNGLQRQEEPLIQRPKVLPIATRQ
jgi:hypothetical protein